MAEKEFSFYELFIPLTNTKVVIFLFFIGLLIFGNSFFNPFIFDDIPQIVQNPPVHTLYSIPSFFITSISLPHTNLPLLHLYYKPLLFTFYAIIWTLFQGNAVGFHLVQVLLHVTNSIFVFLLFTKFFKKSLSFLLSLLFLIHPIQSEPVVYIANLQDILFVFFGLLTINILLQTKQIFNSLTTTLGTFLLLLFSLFSKETGILFCGVSLVSTLLFQKLRKLQTLVAICVALGTYSVFRFVASFSPTSTLTLSHMQKLSLSERLISIPRIIWYYLATFFLPLHLATGQAWIVRTTTLSDFWLPLTCDAIVFVSIILLGFITYKRYRNYFPTFLFFCVWFFEGILFHIQLIPLDLTVADRWFYFPLIGLLGILGVVLQIVPTKTSKHLQTIIVICWIGLFCFLGLLTIFRNAQWQSPFTLYSHDIVFAKDNPVLLSYYGGLLIERGQYAQAKPYLEKSLLLAPDLGSNSINLGAWEEHFHHISNAEQIYKNIIANPTIPPTYKQLAYENLARVLLFKTRDISNAKLVTQQGLHYYSHDELLTEYLAILLYKEGNQQAAEYILESFLKNSPSQQIVSLLQAMKQHAFQLPN